jgi:hypothetical protein
LLQHGRIAAQPLNLCDDQLLDGLGRDRLGGTRLPTVLLSMDSGVIAIAQTALACGVRRRHGAVAAHTTFSKKGVTRRLCWNGKKCARWRKPVPRNYSLGMCYENSAAGTRRSTPKAKHRTRPEERSRHRAIFNLLEALTIAERPEVLLQFLQTSSRRDERRLSSDLMSPSISHCSMVFGRWPFERRERVRPMPNAQSGCSPANPASKVPTGPGTS